MRALTLIAVAVLLALAAPNAAAGPPDLSDHVDPSCFDMTAYPSESPVDFVGAAAYAGLCVVAGLIKG